MKQIIMATAIALSIPAVAFATEAAPVVPAALPITCANAPQNSILSWQCEAPEIAKELKLTNEQISPWAAYVDSYAKAIQIQASVRAQIATLKNVRANVVASEGSKTATTKAEKLKVIEREIKSLADTENAQLRDSARLAKAFIETLSLEQARYALEQNIRFPGIGETFQVNRV